MILWLALIILVIGVLLIGTYWNDWGDFSSDAYDIMENFGTLMTVIGGIALVIMCFIMFINYVTIDAQVDKCKERYNAITYKVENGACRDEFGLLSKEVIDEIQDWNEDVVFHQKMQNNFWLGIFYPDVYDDLKTIDYNKYSK